MGDIYAVYELFPCDTEVDLDAVAKKVPTVLPAGVKFNEADTKVAPVAFGLMKLQVAFVIDDSNPEAGSQLEAALSGIDGIETVECTQNTVL